MCFAKTGANPVRPHMMAMNADQTHAILSFVASGHVLIMNAATRTPVDCIRTSIGAGGARQVHFAIPTPDQKYIAVANQNGKLFERFNTNYETNTFVLDTAAGINLATCTTPNGYACQDPTLRPDNAPICPIIESTSRYVFVTMRGGGLFVVEPGARTGIHHHGGQQTIAYVLSGICEVRWGAEGEYAARATAGDFIHVPAFLPHMEINPSDSEPFRWVVVRSSSTPIVVNLPNDTWSQVKRAGNGHG